MAVDCVELVLCHFVSAEKTANFEFQISKCRKFRWELAPGSRSEKLISNSVSTRETNQTTDLVLVTKPSRD